MLAPLLAAVLLAGCDTVTTGSNFREIGYFQGKDRHRVFSYRIPAGTTRLQISQHGQRLPWTEGRVTFAYYWVTPPAFDGDVAALAPHRNHALIWVCGEGAEESSPDWQYMINSSGEHSFAKP